MPLHNTHPEIVVFDCETTGLEPQIDRVIELAAIRYRWNRNAYEPVDKYNPLLRFEGILAPRIVEITGITDRLLKESGIAEAAAATEFANRFLTGFQRPPLFVAYNAAFDIGFLRQLLARNGKAFPENADYLDMLTVYRDRAAYPHKLGDALEHYQLTDKVQNTHRAIDDCQATFALLEAMAAEEDDLKSYLNLFGYNPNYAIKNRIPGIVYRPQPFRSRTKLYLAK
ncbi:MAG: 3'-5' exonuclease [Bacillus subtilis]|nr:3'-5' exonuclease [Bacillus subtilis]